MLTEQRKKELLEIAKKEGWQRKRPLTEQRKRELLEMAKKEGWQKTKPQEKKDGFFTSLVKDVARPFARTGLNAYRLGEAAITRSGKNITKPANLPFFGKTEVVKTPLGALGTGLEVGSFFAGGGATKGATLATKEVVKRGVTPTVKKAFSTPFLKSPVVQQSATIGAASSGGYELQKEDVNTKDVVKGTLLGGGFGVGFAYLPKLKPTKNKRIAEKKVEKSYQKLFQATKKTQKENVSKLVHKYLKKDTKALGGIADTYSLNKILTKAEEGLELTNKQYEELGKLEGAIDAGVVFDEIRKKKEKMKAPNGRVISTNKNKMKALENLELDIESFVIKKDLDTNQIAQEELRELAKEYGGRVYGTSKSQKTVEDSDTLSQVKEVDSLIRKLLAEKNPSYAAINKVRHKHELVKEILEETLERKAPHNFLSLNQFIGGATAIGSGGWAAGVPGFKNIAIAAGMVSVMKLTGSAGFRSMNARNKTKVFQKLESAKTPLEVVKTVNRLEKLLNNPFGVAVGSKELDKIINE